jgi:hypothetical protein
LWRQRVVECDGSVEKIEERRGDVDFRRFYEEK